MHIAVIGAGSWGTALAGMLGQKYNNVILWVRSEALAQELARTRQNSRYLPGYLLPSAVEVTYNLNRAVTGAQVIVIVTPSHSVRQLAAQIGSIVLREPVQPFIVSAAKGFELNTLKRMSEVIQEEIPVSTDKIVALSGPNHAEEVAASQPTATVVASISRKSCEYIQNVFMSPQFRVYTNPDIIGVELGGSLKNIIALGCGVADGLGLGDNAKAALMTRGLAEITRLGTAMGASPHTFAGLSGLGDLIATCTSRHSRNRRAGVLLASGKTKDEILTETSMVVEGIRATSAAFQIAQKLHVEMPITKQIYQALYDEKSPKDAVMELMTRGKTHEIEDVAADNTFSKE
ncbi:MAG TPA: NAD(P)H-dependent glycerol-3-phosphate dehydrogenase [Methylomusa anaerophila]|uniref:Glycerol-3-phosphate dehydrogenase [NAD(P)+] n=1 Tax=Methylomusa anaerophila TaxID=1930071 RepID=A0A348API3_9FIRM|nr:NAD(P)H-dependent glycerol-3-phosphate dehydrogenase [Methylomusa anaerophila]BBB92981.1 glycerol-3-phosphate dehydrogenase [NAD(P)+] [Methylomusa anaerophila]HML87185.1 NAD(P)H-dependent glycerol-3-phosphate dehydrogenase [Methylomusa anaerophila]